jgi:Ni,Fe-hydrogenase III large subunit
MSFIIPIGPQHPALEEPENFRIEVKGEEIVNVDVRLGYVHRGIEEALTRREYIHGLFLAQRVCGICPAAHSLAYIQAVEAVGGIECPDRARYIRVIAAELERIHSHLLFAGIAAHEIGFTTLFMLFWRDRELALDLKEMLWGNRVHSSETNIGGVRWDIKPNHVPKVLNNLATLEKQVKHYIDVVSTDRTILARCANVGVLTKQVARELCAVGPTVRGSGVNWDIRRDDPYAAYKEVPFKVITERDGDVLAKVMVRLREVLESIYIIRHALDAMPSGPIRAGFKGSVQEGEATGRIEANRGELLYYLLSKGGDKPERVRIRTPSYANITTVKPMLVGGTISEVPIVLASIDPCFSCTDRVTVVDRGTGKTKIMTKNDLRKLQK